MNWASSRIGAAAALLAFLGGCAFAPQLQRVAVDHNRMVARTEDEITLLNIVRAAHRFPLHFTTVTQVNGNASVSVSGGIEAELAKGPDTFTPALGGSASSNPSFQASVLSTDKFQRGIQSPVEPELVAYYLDEGWRDELVMALLIERVEIVRNGEVVGAIVNDAAASSSFARLLCTHQLVTRPTTASRPLARYDQLIDLGKLKADAADAQGRRQEIEAFLKLLDNRAVQLSGDTLVLKGSSNSVALAARRTDRCEGAPVAPESASLRPRFRSTLGVIYFLGEYLRAMEASPKAVYRLPSCYGECLDQALATRPLMAITSGGGAGSVETEFLGRRYYVPRAEATSLDDDGSQARSLQVIAMVQQLVNLQKSADILPRSLTVTSTN